ncbi:hypothetical protein F4813DRAFT_368845 [Daldinia decipiens]|uniref:uncharacterized protein n=1 Tax=Daldinia decipiens TaxID=326647 RepID=UPI0020C360C9|nr:uncharacterized protein F4813DRAFT_368845 [Daldinia decipiens]KAI1654905.1 hypothetical protein F4813DRAFT_368845 [Daldinia decipiens]
MRYEPMANSRMASYHVPKQELLRRAHTENMSLSLALALKDSALGTTPLSHQQTFLSLLKADAPYVAAAIPRILSAVSASIVNRGREASWAELRGVAFYSLLSLLELQLLLSISLLWLVFPGLIILPWLALQTASIWILIRYINGGPRSSKFVTERFEDDISSSEEQRFDWFVVGGFMHDEHMHQDAPKLTRIFGHDMHIFVAYELGLLFDIILIFLQRSLHIPTTRSVNLYNSVRASLLKPETKGVRILAHNTGALDVSWILSRLCADFPPGDRLGKLQVFTFGAASIEMTLPLGHVSYQQIKDESVSLFPLVTHFAFTDDPFAQIGVLLGIRQRLEGRFVGSLYTIHSTTPVSAKYRLLPRSCHYTLDDYLNALLPDGNPRQGILGQVCKIDRELSEMRELAALAQSVTNERLRTRRERLSWTALGAMANTTSSGCGGRDDRSQPFSLEEVRKEGRSLEGLRGYDNNPLVNAMNDARYRMRSKKHTTGTKVMANTEALRINFGKYKY